MLMKGSRRRSARSWGHPGSAVGGIGCAAHTTIGRADWAAPARRRVAQRNNMPDLQTALVHDDALDDELQDGLLVGKRSIIEPAADALAECAEVSQDRLRAHLFAA